MFQFSPLSTSGCSSLSLGSLRIQKCDLKFQLPGWGRKIVRAFGIAVGLDADVYWLKSKSHDSSDTAADWNQPNVAAGSIPVGRDDRRECDVIAFLEVVVDEVLEVKALTLARFDGPAIENRLLTNTPSVHFRG